LHGFDFLFREEPVVFARFEALTARFFINFRHELPGLNVKTEIRTPLNTLYYAWSQLQCHGSLKAKSLTKFSTFHPI
jgi:hypothetical protein